MIFGSIYIPKYIYSRISKNRNLNIILIYVNFWFLEAFIYQSIYIHEFLIFGSIYILTNFEK